MVAWWQKVSNMPDKCKQQFTRLRFRDKPAIPLASDTTVTNRLFAYQNVIRDIGKDSPSLHSADTLHGEIDEHQTMIMPVTASVTTYLTRAEFAAFERRLWLLSTVVMLTIVLLCVMLVVAWLLVMSTTIKGMI
jgi:hypothetical protein